MPETLFTPLRVGNMDLAHRIAMAPLTRLRSEDAPSHVPLPMVAEHYRQRSIVPGTLLISEGVHPFPTGAGYINSPGIWSQAQVAEWRKTTAAVHANGSYIFAQLWAMGRLCSPEALAANGVELLAPSAIAATEKHKTPKEMTNAEVWEAVEGYAKAAKNAIDAGFDGVELHGAHSYFIDEFIQPNSNQRTDEWGGSVEKRAKFPVEVAKAVIKAVGDSKKVAIRFSPWATLGGLGMGDQTEEQFLYVINALKPLGLAYLHLVEPRVNGSTSRDNWTGGDNRRFIEAWGDGTIFLAGGITAEIARKTVDEDWPNKKLVVVFGRLWTSNPDLPYRLQHNIPLVKYDRPTFYNVKEERGYLDWPNSEQFEQEHSSKL